MHQLGDDSNPVRIDARQLLDGAPRWDLIRGEDPRIYAHSTQRSAMIPAGNAQGLLFMHLGTPNAPTPPSPRRDFPPFPSPPPVVTIHPLPRHLRLHPLLPLFHTRHPAP